MVVDYEAAWVELGQHVASKSQHGREATLVEMAEIAARHRVPAGEVSRLLRLYGVEVERARSIEAETEQVEPGAFDGGLASPPDAELAEHHRPGGHDGSQHTAGSGNGRAR